MRAVIAVMILWSSLAYADDPVTFRLKGQVNLGAKPELEVTALEKVSNVVVDLTRGDGKKLALKGGALAKGAHVTLAIGDGSPGKVSYTGKITVQAASGPWSNELVFDTAVLAPIKVTYDADHLDLDKHVLQFKVSRGIDKADIVAIGEDGKDLGKGTAAFKATEPVDAWLSITWTQPAKANVAMLRLRAASNDGGAVNVELVPWSVTVDHEDVNFGTDSFAIDASETAKLDASLAKIEETVKRVTAVKMQLFVAGHTDSVGPNDKNLKLSTNRARAIGAYFRKKGLTIPIVVAGYGEEVLKVQTAQNVDERANRRADYVLAPAGGQPPFKGAYRKVKATWSPIK